MEWTVVRSFQKESLRLLEPIQMELPLHRRELRLHPPSASAHLPAAVKRAI
jgi:hypothetical protein